MIEKETKPETDLNASAALDLIDAEKERVEEETENAEEALKLEERSVCKSGLRLCALYGDPLSRPSHCSPNCPAKKYGCGNPNVADSFLTKGSLVISAIALRAVKRALSEPAPKDLIERLNKMKAEIVEPLTIGEPTYSDTLTGREKVYPPNYKGEAL